MYGPGRQSVCTGQLGVPACWVRNCWEPASWKQQAQRYIWIGPYLLAWSSQKLVDMAKKPFLNSWKFSLEVHEMFTTWHSIHLKSRWCRPMQEGTSRRWRLTLLSQCPWCTPSSLGRVSAATVAVTTCNPCFKAVGRDDAACLAGLPSQGFFKYRNKKEGIPNFPFVCFLKSKTQ